MAAVSPRSSRPRVPGRVGKEGRPSHPLLTGPGDGGRGGRRLIDCRAHLSNTQGPGWQGVSCHLSQPSRAITRHNHARTPALATPSANTQTHLQTAPAARAPSRHSRRRSCGAAEAVCDLSCAIWPHGAARRPHGRSYLYLTRRRRGAIVRRRPIGSWRRRPAAPEPSRRVRHAATRRNTRRTSART